MANVKKIAKITALVLVTLLLVAGATLIGFFFNDIKDFLIGKNSPTKQVQSDEDQDTTAKETCSLCDEETSSSKAALRPVAVMIENSPAARPQSNLKQACLIMEAMAEGGVTRFMAVYVCREPTEVGPVRSARRYFVQIVKGFDALYAHCGGSKYAMEAIKEWGVSDLDQFFHPKVYWRTSRARPHNLYTSVVKLREEGKRSGYESKVQYPGFKFKTDEKLESRPEAQNIIIDFSYPEYKIEYQYQKKSNSYLRFMGGQPHLDAIDRIQIEPKNVAVVYAPASSVVGGSGILDINVTGKGRALLFRDGQMIEGNWEKPALSSQIMFYDLEEEEIEFNPGQTWLELVGLDTPVTHQTQPKDTSKSSEQQQTP